MKKVLGFYPHIKNFAVGVYLLVFLLFLIFGCSQREDNFTSASQPGNYGSAPLFSLPDLDGEMVNLKDLIGKKIILLNFWTISCPHCVAILPRLNQLHKDYKDNLEIVGVNIADSHPRLKYFVEKHQIKYKVIMDKEEKVSYQYGIIGVPTLVVLNLKGEIIYLGHSLTTAEQKISNLGSAEKLSRP